MDVLLVEQMLGGAILGRGGRAVSGWPLLLRQSRPGWI